MSGQVPEANPRTDDYQNKKVNDIKGKCNLKVSEEIISKYWIVGENDEEDKMTPELEKMSKLFDKVQYVVKFRLLRYGKVDSSLPEIDIERFEDYGFKSEDEFNDLMYFILHNNLDIGIQAGNGQFIVKVPSSLNPEVKLKEWLSEHHNVVEDQYVSLSLLQTVAFTDRHKNLVFVFKCDKNFRKPSKQFENGVQFLTSGEVVIPKDRVYFPGWRGTELVQLVDTDEFYTHRNYQLQVTGIFKGRGEVDSLLLQELTDEIFFYKDEAGTPLAVIDNHAYDIDHERVRDEIFLKFYNRTGRHPNSTKIKSVVGAAQILTRYEGKTIADAPFIRDIAPSNKNADLIQQLAEILKMMRQQGPRIEMKALAETTGIDGRVLGRKMKDPKIREELKQAGINYSIDRLAGKNVSVIDMKLVDGVWTSDAEAA